MGFEAEGPKSKHDPIRGSPLFSDLTHLGDDGWWRGGPLCNADAMKKPRPKVTRRVFCDEKFCSELGR